MVDEKRSVEAAFAENLKRIREERFMSQEQVAERMTSSGYSWHQATVYKVESGAREVKLGEAEALSRILGVSVSTLMKESEVASEVARIVHAYSGVRAAREKAVQALQAWIQAQARFKRVAAEDYALNPPGEPWSGPDPWNIGLDVNESVKKYFPQTTVDAMQEAAFEPATDLVGDAERAEEPPF